MTSMEAGRRIELGLTWRSIFVGLVVGLAVQFVLTPLGVAVGLGSFDASSARIVGMGTGLWTALVAIAAWFAGGYACAWSSGVFDRRTGALQGVVSWGLGLFLVLFLVGSSVSGAISAGFGLASEGARAAAMLKGPATAQEAKELGQAAQQRLGKVGPEQAEAVAGVAAKGAWGAFFVAMLSFGAAAYGGAAGARGIERRAVRTQRQTAPTPPFMTPRPT